MHALNLDSATLCAADYRMGERRFVKLAAIASVSSRAASRS
jgi:hypothetical protein